MMNPSLPQNLSEMSYSWSFFCLRDLDNSVIFCFQALELCISLKQSDTHLDKSVEGSLAQQGG